MNIYSIHAPVTRIVRKVVAKWLALPGGCRGAAIILLAFVLQQILLGTVPESKLDKASFDLITAMQKGSIPSGNNSLSGQIRYMFSGSVLPTDPLRPITFINIDDNTHHAWGDGPYTPRNQLLQLIRYAVNNHAAVVVVDIDLSGNNVANDTALLQDADLLEYLGNRDNWGSSTTHVVFARGLGKNPAQSGPEFALQPSLYDGVVASNPYLHWAAPLFELDDDNTIRRWRLWTQASNQPSKDGNALVEGVPSFQLLVSALLSGSTGPTSTTDDGNVQARYRDLRGPDSSRGVYLGMGKQLYFSADPVSSGRMRFFIPWAGNADANTRGHGSFSPVSTSMNWRGAPDHPVLTVMPAIVIASHPDARQDDLAGQIVVIGTSYTNNKDSYSTPLGSMPGAMVIVNAMLSYMSYGEFSGLRPPLTWAIEFCVFALCAFAYLRVPKLWLKAAVYAGGFLLFALPSLSLFGLGIWPEFAAPMIATQLFLLAIGIEGMVDE